MLSFSRKVFLLLLAGSASLNIVQGIPLLGGRYETTSDVQTLLNLALDASDMKEAPDQATKKEIYTKVSFFSSGRRRFVQCSIFLPRSFFFSYDFT